MEMGTLGDRRQAEFDALYAEAKQVLGQGANQLRAVTESLRQAIASDLLVYQSEESKTADRSETREHGTRLVRGRALLARLELAAHDLEQCWLFLERGMTGEWEGTGRSAADVPQLDLPTGGPAAMQILEAQEGERARLAEELHDGPAQVLANAAFQVEIVDRTMRSQPDAVKAELDTLRTILERELERMRGFIHQLRPDLGEQGGLGTALHDLADRMTSEAGIPVEIDLGAPEEPLDLPTRGAVLRVAQEALRNVRKHAAASHVRLSTSLDGSGPTREWVLEVTDDGRGFSVDEVLERSTKRHFGLRFMRERAQLIGARLEIVSNPSGTTVRLALAPRERS